MKQSMVVYVLLIIELVQKSLLAYGLFSPPLEIKVEHQMLAAGLRFLRR